MSAGNSVNPFTRSLVRSANVRFMSRELASVATNEAGVKAYEELGFVTVEGDERDVRQALDRNGLVAYYEEDKKWKVAATSSSVPSSQYRSPWMSDTQGLTADVPAFNVAPTGSHTIVAVVDTGIRLDMTPAVHPYMRDAMEINTTEMNGSAGVDDDGNGYIDDIYGLNVLTMRGAAGDMREAGADHGSHVAGLVKSMRDQAIENLASPYKEKAANVTILPVRFIDSSGVGTTSGAVAALHYARVRGARVVNASWGAKGTAAFSQALYDAMVQLYQSDVVISVAAGNADVGVANNNDITPYFPSSFNIPGLISVASLTSVYAGSLTSPLFQYEQLSYFSNYGATTVDIVAPGDYQDANGNSDGVWSADGLSDGYERKKGTSMAAPVVAGVAGVIRALNPTLTNYEVKQLITSTARASGAYAGRVKTGAALNASAAFTAAMSATTQGLRPAVSGAAYYSASGAASSSSGRGGGGCGMVKSVNGAAEEGPLAGNSLGLLLVGYLTFVLLRLVRKGSITN